MGTRGFKIAMWACYGVAAVLTLALFILLIVGIWYDWSPKLTDRIVATGFTFLFVDIFVVWAGASIQTHIQFTHSDTKGAE